MIYEQVEDHIVAHLQAKFVGLDIDVVKMPENDADLQRPFKNGKVTVFYRSSTYGDGGDNRHRAADLVVQQETLSIDVVLQSRSLRAPEAGIYPMWDVTRRALMGFRPADCGRMFIKDFELVDRGEGLFTFSATFMADRLVVEDYDEAQFQGPNITQITLHNELTGEDTVTP